MLEKTFLKTDGSRRFKHLIEPYITYRLIGGVGDYFARIIRFDERDAVANTNELEYAMRNRFFITRKASELKRKRARRQTDEPDEMEPVSPDRKQQRKPGKNKAAKKDPGATTSEDKNSQAPPPANPEAKPPESKEPEQKESEQKEKSATEPEAQVSKEKSEAAADKKQKLETGEQQELAKGGKADQARNARRNLPRMTPLTIRMMRTQMIRRGWLQTRVRPSQPYEFLMIKVAQKYF